jgi:hypothetical protein
MSRENLENWYKKVDDILAQEDEFNATQHELVDQNAIEAEEAELAIEAFHRYFIDGSYS